jgi:pyruvate/2-oxoglutarate dehydrogenase complex dihydrolipoamide dehydrogenase (E3) component
LLSYLSLSHTHIHTLKGGLVTSAATSRKFGKCALIESHMMGGDCLNVGCVPSKSLLAAAKQIHLLRKAEKLGVTVDRKHVQVDFPRIMQRLRGIRARIAENDSQQRFTQQLNVDLFFGRAAFSGPNSLVVNGNTIRFKKCCIATGARATVPAIPGLAEAPYYTNATIFNLTTLPQRVAVIGAGAVGCELGQAFACLGSSVEVFYRAPRILKGMDAESAGIVASSMQADGVTLRGSSTYVKVTRSEDGKTTLHYSVKDDPEVRTTTVDVLLLAAGRTPNVEDLQLSLAGVKVSPTSGIVQVDDFLCTANPDVYAVGDVAVPKQHRFTHLAGETATMVVENCFGESKRKYSDLVVSGSVFTFPELASVGMTEAEVKVLCGEGGYHTFNRPFSITDRNICDGDEEGLCKVFTPRDSDTILGAVVCGSSAGEMISTLTLAMYTGQGARQVGGMIVPYPTKMENIKYCCGR